MKGSRSSSNKKRCRRSLLGLLAWCVILSSGCAGLERRFFERPFDSEAVAFLTGELRAQNEKVQSFFSVGRLQARGWQGEAGEAATFCAGTTSPLRIKIEVTHEWGQPILQILIESDRFRYLSFTDRKLYVGSLNSPSLAKLLPGDMDQSLLHTLVRAYPVLPPHQSAHSHEPNQITFHGEGGGHVRIITFERDSLRPKEVTVPPQSIKLVFSDFQSVSGIHFAGETLLVHALGGRRLSHKVKSMVFNRSIPEEVFSIRAPPGFEEVPLSP